MAEVHLKWINNTQKLKKNGATLMCDTIVGYLNSTHHIGFSY